MPSGGARTRSGPPPDPSALRRDRKDDASWVTLPAEGFDGEIPVWPLSEPSRAEAVYWAELWRKPQAVMWDRLGMVRQVAAYTRAFVEASEREASAGLKTAVLRMEGELGLSLPGMHSLRWKFSEDELEAKRSEASSGVSPQERARALRAVGDS